MIDSTLEKHCGKCGFVKPLTNFNPSGKGMCHECRRKNRPKYAIDITEKRCSKCKIVKVAGQFYYVPTNKHGLDSACKKCANAAALNRYRQRRRTTGNGRMHPYHRAGPEVTAERKRAGHLRRKYGITQDQLDALLVQQDGKCVCGKVFGTKGDLCIDHDHACCPGEASCGKCVRGLLCRRCNMALGYLFDSPVTLVKLALYLGVFDTKPVWRKRLEIIADRLGIA